MRIAYQPNWPLRATVIWVTVPGSGDPADLYDEGERAAGQDQDSGFCWLAAGSPPWAENPYAPRWAWRGGEASRDY